MTRGADPGGEPDQPKRGRASKHGGRLLKVALLGGAVALLVNEDLRNQLLDALFGAEEEFHYSSVTEPPVPGNSPAPSVSGEPPPVSLWTDPATDDDATGPLAADEPAPSDWTSTRVPRAVAPSPAAWAASSTEPEPAPDAPPSAEPPHSAERSDYSERADAADSTEAPDTTEAPDSTEVRESNEVPESTEVPESSEVPEGTAGTAGPAAPALPRDWWSQEDAAPERDEESGH